MSLVAMSNGGVQDDVRSNKSNGMYTLDCSRSFIHIAIILVIFCSYSSSTILKSARERRKGMNVRTQTAAQESAVTMSVLVFPTTFVENYEGQAILFGLFTKVTAIK